MAPGRPTAPRRASSTPRDLTAGVKAEALASVSRMLTDLIMVVMVMGMVVNVVAAEGAVDDDELAWAGRRAG